MKRLFWVILIIAAVLYSLIVWSWIQEGNRNFEKQRIERNQ